MAVSTGSPDIADVHPGTEVDAYIVQDTLNSIPLESSNGQSTNGDFRPGCVGAWWPGRAKSVKGAFVIVEVFFDGPTHPPMQEVIDIDHIRVRSHEPPLSLEQFQHHIIDIPSDLTEL